MNEFIEILDRKEQELSQEVEDIFRKIEKEGRDEKYKDYTKEANERIKRQIADTGVGKLKDIRAKYISDCEKAIENTKMTVPQAVIRDSFSLETTRYKVISKPLESQIELLRNTTNISDFEIIKGMILDKCTDSETIRKIQEIKAPSEETLKSQAIGQLRLRTANLNWIPSVKLNRALSISNAGLENYLLELLGISNSNIYFR